MADIRIKYKVDKGELVIARNELEKINAELGVTKEKGGQLTGSIKTVGTAIVAAFTVDKLIDFGRQVVSVTAEFQKLSAVLTNTLGSKSAADKAFRDIQDFAAKTPFSVQQLTASFVKLANQGFIPTTNELRKLGDLAASTGKDFDMLTEAIIDAQVGEFERLKEFGIRASKEGDKVKFTFKGVQTQTDFTAQSIQQYILSLGDLQGVSGSMAAISETLGGKLSNLGDSFDTLLYAIGQGLNPAIGGAIEGFSSLIGTIAKFLSLSTAEKLEEERNELNLLVTAATAANVTEQARLSLINEIQSKYPDFLKNIDAEKVSNEQLKTRLEDVNGQLLRKIILEEQSEKINEFAQKRLTAIKDEREAQKDLIKAQEQYNEVVRLGYEPQAIEGASKAVDLFKNRIVTAQKEQADALLQSIELQKEYQGLIDEFAGSSSDYTDPITPKTDPVEAAKPFTETLELQKKGIKDLETATLESDKVIVDATKVKNDQLTEIERQAAADREAIFQAEQEAKLEAFKVSIGQLAQALDMFGNYGRGLALFQIGLDTAQAISALVKASEQNPANAVTFGGAGIAQFISGVARITANIANAKKLISNPPERRKFAKGVIDLQGGIEGQDSIHAMLMPHESVMTAKETRNFMPTLKAIRENRIDPVLLNSIATGQGSPSVINMVNEVPRDEYKFVWDEEGFSKYMRKKNQTVVKKNIRYKC